MSVFDRAMEAHRRLEPELYEKVDAIARIIDPSAFAEWHDSTDPDAPPRRPTVRQRYMSAHAKNVAYQILQYLGIAPEKTDWLAIFAEMDRTPPNSNPEPWNGTERRDGERRRKPGGRGGRSTDTGRGR